MALIPSDSAAAGSGSDASRRWLSWRHGAGVPSPCDAGAQLRGAAGGQGPRRSSVQAPAPAGQAAGGSAEPMPGVWG